MGRKSLFEGDRRRTPAGLFLSLVAAASALAGCSSMKVYSDFDPAADFQTLKTWDWIERSEAAAGDPRIQDSLVRGRIEGAISDELLRRGYRLAISQEPDFLVAYHAALNQKLDVQIVNSAYGYPYEGNYGATWGPAPQSQSAIPVEYQQGTLVVDILDGKSRQLIWRGTVEAEVYPDLEPAKREERIREAARKVLSQFPPR